MYVLSKQDSTKRPWLPFKQDIIRATGNNKTNPTPKGKKQGRKNVTGLGPIVNSVKGCPLARLHGGRGCYGDCYPMENLGRYHIKYWVPIPQILDERKLHSDLMRIRREKEYSWISFLRDGEKGDPSLSWEIATRISEIGYEHGFSLARLTKFIQEPSDEQLVRQADSKTVLHGSVSALDPFDIRQRVLESLERYDVLGGRVVHRVITADFQSDLKDLWELQDSLMEMKNVLQQPLRLRKSNPFLKLINPSALEPTVSHLSEKRIARWKTAGAIYDAQGCYSHKCYLCENKCMTEESLWSDGH